MGEVSGQVNGMADAARVQVDEFELVAPHAWTAWSLPAATSSQQASPTSTWLARGPPASVRRSVGVASMRLRAVSGPIVQAARVMHEVSEHRRPWVSCAMTSMNDPGRMPARVLELLAESASRPLPLHAANEALLAWIFDRQRPWTLVVVTDSLDSEEVLARCDYCQVLVGV